MNTRGDHERRSYKRSRSPEGRERPPRDEKRQRAHVDERERRRSSRYPSRSSTAENGRDERHQRRDERRERDSRIDGSSCLCPCANVLGESRRYDRDRHERGRDRRDRKPTPEQDTSKSSANRKRVSLAKPTTPPASSSPPPSPHSNIPPSSDTKVITTAELLEEPDPPLSDLMGFTKFSSTKGKKHQDYGTVEIKKKRSYRQYMNRPGGFNRPLD